jgi:hypothetical protein
MRRVGAYFLVAFVSTPLQFAAAGSMPDIKASARNAVPACVTPGRLIDYLKSRNPDLSPRFESVAVEYMRYGEKLGIRWDYAFYQMILETGALSYRNGSRAGDVKPTQNNFAGLGATGRGEPGESFKDVATGVRAHLEHLLHYSGERIENPTAERTRKVQEWNVLASWHARFDRPITFGDLASKWAPGSGSYVRMLEGIAERFEVYCGRPDPRPELVAEARGRTNVADVRPEKPSGAEFARRAIQEGKADDLERRSTLGVLQAQGEQPAANKAPPTPYKILNPPPEAERQAVEAPAAEPPATPMARAESAPPKTKPNTTGSITPTTAPATSKANDKPQYQVASAAGAAKMAPPVAAQKCRVWTASYGGQKALIIKSMVDKVVNYTVLDVNEGAEKREADAFISAYAKDGAVTGEYGNQSQALDKAFELCPEG